MKSVISARDRNSRIILTLCVFNLMLGILLLLFTVSHR